MRLDITLAVVLGFLITASVNAMGQERVLHAFNGRDGVHPVGSLNFDMAGNLYGTTLDGGDDRCDCGTVWTETILHNFNGEDGTNPDAALVFDAKGNLYGTTFQGGNSKSCGGCGTVFKLSPGANDKWTETVLHSFNGDDGEGPFLGSMIFGAAGNLYGATNTGGNLTACQNSGSNGCGVVFEVRP